MKKCKVSLNDKIHPIIEKIQYEYLIFNSINMDCKKWCKENLDTFDKSVYKKIKEWIITTRSRPKDITIYDGAKKTVISNKSDIVLKLYPRNGKSLYLKEKKNYSIINKNNLHHLFVKQYNWDDNSLTANATKIDSMKPIFPNSAKKIQEKLLEKGFMATDISMGDNIGHHKGRDIIFDVKSLKKI